MNNLNSVKVVLLGLAQDAGVPQLGCDCENCQTVNSENGWPVSLAIIDDEKHKFWMIDATPRFPQQYDWLRKQFPTYHFSGILLTHAHVGHYTGLVYLGKEAMNTKSLPIYGSPTMLKFLQSNAPWSQLVDLHNIELIVINSEENIELTTNLTIKPVLVTHRSEFSDTLAFLIKGPASKLFYCPDIDHWDGLDLSKHLDEDDYALLDGTFYSPDELPGRDMTEIPHPFVTETVKYTQDQQFKTWIIHLNHSNPIWRKGKETERLAKQFIRMPSFGKSWVI